MNDVVLLGISMVIMIVVVKKEKNIRVSVCKVVLVKVKKVITKVITIIMIIKIIIQKVIMNMITKKVHITLHEIGMTKFIMTTDIMIMGITIREVKKVLETSLMVKVVKKVICILTKVIKIKVDII